MVKLDAVAPTAEELADAKSILAKLDKKGMRSKMGSLSHFLSLNAENTIADTSRGDKRKAYLEIWQVHQLREKAAKKSMTSKHTVTTSTANKQDVYWWSKFKMDTEMGPVKSEAWRTSGKLKTRGDKMTGSLEDELIEYAVPVDWNCTSHGEDHAAVLVAEGDADEKSRELVDDASRHFQAEGDLQPLSSAVKVKEEKDDRTDEDKKLDDIKKNPKQYLRTFQDMKTSVQELEFTIEKEKFAANLKDECQKIAPKIKSLVQIFEVMITKVPAEKAMMTLSKKTMECEKDWAECRAYAEKMGYLKKSGRKK